VVLADASDIDDIASCPLALAISKHNARHRLPLAIG
jgi:hypothetical protein